MSLWVRVSSNDVWQSSVTDPVEDLGPALHSDRLVDGEHGEADVVKVGDAVVGPHPVRPALRPVDRAAAAVTGLSAGRGRLALRRSEDIWNQDDIKMGERISVTQIRGAGWANG